MQANNTLRHKVPMRKRVDTSGYAQLSREKREALRDWWEPQKWDTVLTDFTLHGRKVWLTGVVVGITSNKLLEVYVDDYQGVKVFGKEQCLLWFDIGQCIELLKEKDFAKLQKVIMLMFTPRWTVSPLEITCPMNDTEMLVPVELIDALWQAVKEVI